MTQIGTPQTSQTLEIAAMVGQFEEPLVRYATRILGDRERARDVVQDTFVRLCQAEQGSIERPREWLFRVCRNRAIDLQRRDRRQCGLDHIPEALTGAPSTAEQQATAGEIRQLFAQLPDSQRKVMALRFEQGESYRTIGAQTGLATGTVGHLIHQGVRRLRSRLGVAVLVLLAAGGAAWWRSATAARTPASATLAGCGSAAERVSSATVRTLAAARIGGEGPDGEPAAGDWPAHDTQLDSVMPDGAAAAGARAAATASATANAPITPAPPKRAQRSRVTHSHATSDAVARSAQSAPPPATSAPPKGPEPPPARRVQPEPEMLFELE